MQFCYRQGGSDRLDLPVQRLTRPGKGPAGAKCGKSRAALPGDPGAALIRR